MASLRGPGNVTFLIQEVLQSGLLADQRQIDAPGPRGEQVLLITDQRIPNRDHRNRQPIGHPAGPGWDLDEHRSKKSTYFEIPYRSLVPEGLDNLLLAGRMLGTTQEAYSATRVMGTGIATGQAAGTAAALAIKKRTGARQVNISELKETLRSQSVVI